MQNNHVQQQPESVMNPSISLQPVDPSFYNPVLVSSPYQPTLLTPMVSLNSDGSSGLQKLGSASSLTSVSPNGLQMGAMNFSTSSPLLTQATSPLFFPQPAPIAQGQFFVPMTVSPRFTTPSVSPQPPMVEQAPFYISPSPLLLTPQHSTTSVSSDSAADVPNMFLTGNTFSLLPPSASFTSSRTPERFAPTNISPIQSPQRTPTQIGFRERPISQSNTQAHGTGYPPKPTASDEDEEAEPSEEPVASKKQKKFGYRSKQRKIDRTHKNIQEKFSALGLFAKERELVRGDDTLRIHVKTFEGLTDIQSALDEIHDHEDIEIVRVAAVFSKKNRFQKKGFIVYLKVGSVAQVELCKQVLGNFDSSLRNVAIAKAKTPQASKQPAQATNPGLEQFSPVVPITPGVSATAM